LFFCFIFLGLDPATASNVNGVRDFLNAIQGNLFFDFFFLVLICIIKFFICERIDKYFRKFKSKVLTVLFCFCFFNILIIIILAQSHRNQNGNEGDQMDES